jgi:hypothetical protein
MEELEDVVILLFSTRCVPFKAVVAAVDNVVVEGENDEQLKFWHILNKN